MGSDLQASSFAAKWLIISNLIGELGFFRDEAEVKIGEKRSRMVFAIQYNINHARLEVYCREKLIDRLTLCG